MTDPVVDKIVAKMYDDDKPKIELHETVESPNWDLKPRCSCGERSDNNLRHYMHQADALREQLKQLG